MTIVGPGAESGSTPTNDHGSPAQPWWTTLGWAADVTSP